MSHSLLGPSGAHAWSRCAAKLAMESNEPNDENSFAFEGTCAHTIHAECLEKGHRAETHVGRVFRTGDFSVAVDDTMAEYIQESLDRIAEMIAAYYARGASSVQTLVEVRVDISEVLNYPKQFGTSDVALLVTWPGEYDEIHVIDFKYGRGVQVDAAENEQLILYVGGTLNQFSTLGDYGRFSMTIHQPRTNHWDTWECDLNTLERALERLRIGAALASEIYDIRPHVLADQEKYSDSFRPEEETCRFCRAKHKCFALQHKVSEEVFADFEVLDAEPAPSTAIVKENPVDIGRSMAVVGMVEDWCKAIRAQAEILLLNGSNVPGYKLVKGRKGNRAWTSEQEAEEILKSMRLRQEEMYSFKLISPTNAEKLLKPTQKRWTRISKLIHQPDGALSVAATSDKRDAVVIKPVEDDFEDLTKEQS